MDKIENNRIHVLIIVLLVVLGIVVSSMYTYGDDIRADEVFSLGFANNTRDFLFLTKAVCDEYSSDGWLSGEFIKEYFAVEKGEELAIMSIHRNVRNDVHPPLYFMLLNAVSSLWTGEYTVMPGHIINITIAAVMLVFLYLIGNRLLTNKLEAAMISVMWIGSIGAADSINYIRMYLALCTITVIVIYISMLIMEDNTGVILYIVSGMCVTVGTLVHYYFYIMFFFVLVYVSIWHISHKRYKRLAIYYGFVGLGEAISLALYPYAFKHMLFSDRGEQVQEHLANTDLNYYLEHAKGFAATINTEIFNGYAWIVLVVLLILFCVKVVRKKNSRLQIFRDNSNNNLGLLVTVIVGYFAVLFKISYSYNWLYISLIYALVDIVLVCVIAYLCENLFNARGIIVLVVCIFIFSAIGVYISTTESLHKHEAAVVREENLNSYVKNNPVIFVYDEWENTLDNQNATLINADCIYFIKGCDLSDTKWDEIMNKCPTSTGEIIFYLSAEVKDGERYVTECADLLGMNYSNCIWKDNYIISLLKKE